MRLWDTALSEGIFEPGARRRSLIADGDRHPIVVRADNVARYLYEESDQEFWALDKDFPNVAPPWPYFVVEWRAPSIINSNERGVQPWDGPPEFATGIRAHPVEALPAMPDRDELVEGGGWLCKGEILMREGNRVDKARIPMLWRVLPNGTVPPRPHEQDSPYLWFPGLRKGDPESMEALGPLQSFGLWVPFLTLSFLHCKNVQVRAMDPPPKLAKKHAKRGRTMYRFHVLDIEPMTASICQTQQEHGVGTSKALHIRRGEFRDYTEKGLFGKHRGIYWFDAHLRGSPKQGMVDKDYNVNSPTGTAEAVAAAAEHDQPPGNREAIYHDERELDHG